MVVDAQIDPALVFFAVAAEELFVRHVNADDGFGLEALLGDVLLQKGEIIWNICCYYARVLALLTERKTKRKAAAERVAVWIGVGQDVEIVVRKQKVGCLP